MGKNDYYPVLIGMERLDAKACQALRSQLTADLHAETDVRGISEETCFDRCK